MDAYKPSNYRYRLLSRVVIEACTPLSVGSGEDNIDTDSVVARDANGLPYIPGTALAGVVRSILDPSGSNEFFGVADGKGGVGSKIIISDAMILDSDSRVVDGLRFEAAQNSFLRNFEYLPVRQHVRINEYGTAENAGKFDNEVVFAGTRFCFEMEVVSSTAGSSDLDNVLLSICGKRFMIGGGTRKGYGQIGVVDVKTALIDLADEKSLQAYIKKSSNLEESSGWEGWTASVSASLADDDSVDSYVVSLKPKDFFLFSSGFGDAAGYADQIPVRERKVVWEGSKGKFSDAMVLVPGSSVKGALAHRTKFYLNAAFGNFSDQQDAEKSAKVRKAAESLFGRIDGRAMPGKVIVSDVYVSDDVKQKYINHVSIDAFTGGAINGALFTELVDYSPESTLTFEIDILKDGADPDAVRCFEKALKDLCSGSLPLGGGTNRGNGLFAGNVTRNGIEL